MRNKDYSISESDTILLIIDVQEKLLQGISEKSKIIANIVKLVKASKVLGVEIIYTEQNPDKLGNTIERVIIDENHSTYKKMSFNCLECNELLENLYTKNKKNIIICGVESHICVQQTCLDLTKKDFRAHIVVDAIGSRNLIDHKISIRRLELNNVDITTAESIIFELCRTADRKEFKEISSIIKEPLYKSETF
tara:strand:- start:1311 stop:1892 length:582 start_codon:yes stop_codon:yes gene_type:complete